MVLCTPGIIYCYYDNRRTNDLEVAFDAFRAVYNNDEDEEEEEGEEVSRYYLRSGSYTYSTWTPERQHSHVTQLIWKRTITSRYMKVTDLVLVV